MAVPYEEYDPPNSLSGCSNMLPLHACVWTQLHEDSGNDSVFSLNLRPSNYYDCNCEIVFIETETYAMRT